MGNLCCKNKNKDITQKYIKDVEKIFDDIYAMENNKYDLNNNYNLLTIDNK